MSSLPFLQRDIPVLDRAAQLLGITGGATLAGLLFCMSAYTIPSLLEAPAKVAVGQWFKTYESAKLGIPPATMLVSGLYGYLAYRARHGSRVTVGLYAAAAALAPIISPWTLIAMASTNDELIDRANDKSGTSSEIASRDSATKALLDRWASLNIVRSLILITSAGLATWASLSPVEVLGLDRINLTSGANRLG